MKKTFLIGAVGLASVLSIPTAQAKDTANSYVEKCKPSLCARANAGQVIDCRPTGTRTITCSASVAIRGYAEPTHNFYPVLGHVSYSGEATFDSSASCGYIIDHGQHQSCGAWTDSASTSWPTNELGGVYHNAGHTFSEFSHTSDEPFCLAYTLTVASKTTAKTSLLGLNDQDEIEAYAFVNERGDEACID